MNKRTIFLLLLTAFILTTIYFVKNGQLNSKNISEIKNFNLGSAICYDCGQDGWQKMAVKCDQEILNKNDFKKCLMNFSWSSVNNETSLGDIKEGYIEMNSHERLNSPTEKTIKVFIYHQWATDKEGNLYIDGQLG